MTTCRPDLSQAVVKCAQGTAAPSETHYLAVRSIFCYVAATMADGIVFWRTQPRLELPTYTVPYKIYEYKDDPVRTHCWHMVTWTHPGQIVHLLVDPPVV